MADKRTIAGRSPSSCVKAIWVVATLFLPSMGFCSRGQILSASASPTYRGSTVTLYLVVVNSSNFTWGTDLCPAYAITARPSWGLQGTEATGYSWFALGAGNTQSVFWQWGEFGPPDARTDHYLDVTLSAPESPGSCRYVVVDRSRVPLTCAEWPDLVAVGSVVSAYGPVMAGLVGSSLTATIRQTNLGPGPVLFYSWTEVRLSEDENYDFSKDPWLASVLVEPIMQAGEQRDYCRVGTVPVIKPADYFVIIASDALNQVPEAQFRSGEDNNVYVLPRMFRVLGADLAVTAASVSPSPVAQGQGAVVQFAVSNLGNYPNIACFAEVLISSGVKGTDIYWLRNVSVPPISPGTTATVTIPTAVPIYPRLVAKAYDLVVNVDLNIPYRVTEYQKQNNRLVAKGALNLLVTTGTAVLPDLAVTSGSVAPNVAVPLQRLNVRFQVDNVGAAASPACYGNVFLSSDTQGTNRRPWIERIPIASLAGGAGLTARTSATLPSLPARSYTTVVEVDYVPPYLVTEPDKNNNRLVLPDSLLLSAPYLTVTSGTIYPADGIPRDWVYTAFAIRNLGTVASGATAASAYLSTDTVLTAGDRLLTNPPMAVPALAAGVELTSGVARQVPQIAPGWYNLILVCGSSTYQAGKFKVTAPDLTAGAVTFTPPEGRPGTAVSLSVQIVNAGDRPGPTDPLGPPSEARVYLSRYPFASAPFPRSSDYLWFSFSVPRLGPASGGPGYPSSAYTYSSTMTVPAVPPSPDTAPVGYRVLVQCDATSSIIEFDETNNIMEKGRFRIIFGADLVIPQGYVRRLFGMPDRNAQVSVTVSNAGDMPASSSLLALYFSDDDVLDSSDTVWASNISIPALSAGASFTYSDVLPVPPASEGTYHIIARCDAAGSVDRWSDNNTHDLGPLSLQTRVRYWPHYK